MVPSGTDVPVDTLLVTGVEETPKDCDVVCANAEPEKAKSETAIDEARIRIFIVNTVND